MELLTYVAVVIMTLICVIIGYAISSANKDKTND